MGNNTLTTIAGGIGKKEQVNQYKEALVGDILPRNTDGIPSDGAGSLGGELSQFDNLYIKNFIYTNGSQGGFVPSGVMLPYTCSSSIAPAGWIFADGKTIGNTGSGADHEGEEFRFLFNIYKAVSAYGNTGAEDFDLGGKVKIPNPAGRFIRPIGPLDPDGVRGMGSVQATAVGQHRHGTGTSSSDGNSADGRRRGLGYGFTDYTDYAGGAESRPANMAFPYIIKV